MTIEEQMAELKIKQRELEVALSEKRRFDQAKKFLDEQDLCMRERNGGFEFVKILPDDIAKSRDTSVGYDDLGFPICAYDYGNGGVSWLMVKDEATALPIYRRWKLLENARSTFSIKMNITSEARRKMFEEMMDRIVKEWVSDAS